MSPGSRAARKRSSPQGAGVWLGIQFLGDGVVGRSLRCSKDDLSPEHNSVGSGATASPGGELGAFLVSERDPWSDPHTGAKGAPGYKRSQP